MNNCKRGRLQSRQLYRELVYDLGVFVFVSRAIDVGGQVVNHGWVAAKDGLVLSYATFYNTRNNPGLI